MSTIPYKRIIVLILALILLIVLPVKSAQAPTREKPIPTDVKGMISYYAEQYGANEHQLMVVAFCESGYRPNAVGDGGRAKNIFQFHEPTFDRFSRLLGEELNYNSAHDQAKLAAFIFAHYPQYRSHWTCFSKNFHI